tara:strand:- start:877 stop:1221 length:345 start_codon:yes stop_codon:yes gene_type:complete
MSKHNHTECTSALLPVRDALDVVSGKWKLLILISIKSGNNRFREIERSIPKITSKVLAKELKDLECNQLITRTVYDSSPVLVEYKATVHSESLEPVISALRDWGIAHRKKIIGT